MNKRAIEDGHMATQLKLTTDAPLDAAGRLPEAFSFATYDGQLCVEGGVAVPYPEELDYLYQTMGITWNWVFTKQRILVFMKGHMIYLCLPDVLLSEVSPRVLHRMFAGNLGELVGSTNVAIGTMSQTTYVQHYELGQIHSQPGRVTLISSNNLQTSQRSPISVYLGPPYENHD